LSKNATAERALEKKGGKHAHWNADSKNDHRKGVAVELLVCLLVEKSRVVVAAGESISFGAYVPRGNYDKQHFN
jgi:hypothetical protein